MKINKVVLIFFLLFCILLSACSINKEENDEVNIKIGENSDYNEAMNLRYQKKFNVQNKNILNISDVVRGDSLFLDVVTDELSFPYNDVFQNIVNVNDVEKYEDYFKLMLGLNKDVESNTIALDNAIRMENGFYISFFKKTLNNYSISLMYSDGNKFDYNEKSNISFDFIKNNMGIDLMSSEILKNHYNDFLKNNNLNHLQIDFHDSISHVGVQFIIDKIVENNDKQKVGNVGVYIYNDSYNLNSDVYFVYSDINKQIGDIKFNTIGKKIIDNTYFVELMIDNIIFPNEDVFGKVENSENIEEYMYILEDMMDVKYNKEISMLYGMENYLIDEKGLKNAGFIIKKDDFYYTTFEFILTYNGYEDEMKDIFDFINKNYKIDLNQCDEFLEVYNEFLSNSEITNFCLSILGTNDDNLSIDINFERDLSNDYHSIIIQNVRFLN